MNEDVRNIVSRARKEILVGIILFVVAFLCIILSVCIIPSIIPFMILSVLVSLYIIVAGGTIVVIGDRVLHIGLYELRYKEEFPY